MKPAARITWILGELVCVFCIVAAVYRIVMPLEQIYDVAVYDETALYLKPALNFAWAEFSFYRSPAYVLWYAGLHALSGLDPIALYYANHVILLMGLALALYVGLRSYSVRRRIALPLVIYGVLWTVHLKALPRSVYFLLIGFLLYASAVRLLVRSERGRAVALIPLICFLSYVRAEFIAALLPACVYLAWVYGKGRVEVAPPLRVPALILPGLLFVLSLGLFVSYGTPGGDQSRVDILELTVLQHYVRGYGERFNVPVPVDLAALPEWYARSFGPGEPGVLHMMRSNPAEFLRHAGFNAALLIESFSREFRQHWPVLASSDAAGMAKETRRIGYVLFVTGGAAVLLLRRKLFRVSELREHVCVLAVLVAPFGAACLVFYPREHYLLPLLCAALLLFGHLLELGVRRIPERYAWSPPVAWRAGLILAGVLVLVSCLPRAVTVVETILAGPVPRPNLETIRYLNGLAAHRRIRVITADEGLLEYVPNAEELTLKRGAGGTLEDRLKQSDVLLFDYPELLPAYFADSALRRQLEAGGAVVPAGWQRRSIEGAPFRLLFVHNDLL